MVRMLSFLFALLWNRDCTVNWNRARRIDNLTGGRSAHQILTRLTRANEAQHFGGPLRLTPPSTHGLEDLICFPSPSAAPPPSLPTNFARANAPKAQKHHLVNLNLFPPTSSFLFPAEKQQMTGLTDIVIIIIINILFFFACDRSFLSLGYQTCRASIAPALAWAKRTAITNLLYCKLGH